jgi:hypothetical protein
MTQYTLFTMFQLWGMLTLACTLLLTVAYAKEGAKP